MTKVAAFFGFVAIVTAASVLLTDGAERDLGRAVVQGPIEGGEIDGSDIPDIVVPDRGHQPPVIRDGAQVVTFDELASFWYELPDPLDATAKTTELDEFDEFELELVLGLDQDDAGSEQIPPEIRELDGNRVEVSGFMMAIGNNDQRKVTTFVLSRYPGSCCFGQFPEINEWVDVVVEAEDGVEPILHGTCFVRGTLRVGESYDDYGYVRSIYRMTAESVFDRWQ